MRLRNLIRGYPKGVGIIKEFLQNADDAGATRVDIVMDWRVHSTQRTPGSQYARLAGPALLIANDAPFAEDDFKNIQSLGQSGKQLVSTKIGKFGLGFNAVYNVTDHPTFLSRDQLYLFDPSRTVVGKAYPDAGIAFDIAKDELWSVHPELLAPFCAAGLTEGQSDLPRTIFRLPIRTETLAAQSTITEEPFEAADFEEILAQLNARAAELLLFLQHVLTLRVVVIAPDGVTEAVLDVETTNPEEVAGGRRVVTAWLREDHQETLQALRASSGQGSEGSFRHRLRVRGRQGDSEVEWLVTNGLHLGPEGALVDLAEAMLRHGEKALPVAGAAVQIGLGVDGRPRPQGINGLAYCGLPLPRPTSLAMHINGYFDLDDARTWLRLNPETAGAYEQLRRQWNSSLLHDAVAPSIVSLLTELVRLEPETDPEDLYSLFPPVGAAPDGLLPGLAAAVVNTIWHQKARLIHVGGAPAAWRAPQDVLLLPDEWWDQLAAPLLASQRPIPVPKLPAAVAQSFAAVGHSLKVLTPKALRDAWRRKDDVNVALPDAPEAAWRSREWVTDLLAFAVSDRAKDLKGVPLALLADNRLHTFGFSIKVIFLAADSERSIFADFPHWFMDADVARRAALVPGLSPDLQLINPELVLKNLHLALGSVEDVTPWQPGGQEIPNAKWLTTVFEYLADADALTVESNRKLLRSLPVVPDQFGRLHHPGRLGTPLWQPADRGQAKSLAEALDRFKVPIVTGSAELLKAMRKVFGREDDPLVYELTGPDLVDVLYSTLDTSSDEILVYQPGVHDRLLTFLASANPASFTEDQYERLRELPIFATRDNKVVRLTDANVMVAEVGALPRPPGEVRLVKAKDPAARKLLERTGARMLNRRTLVSLILAADLATLEAEHREELLRWLRLHLETILQDVGESERASVVSQLGEQRMIRDSDGGLCAARRLYDPSAVLARHVLGAEAAFPDTATAYAHDTSLWLEFFRRLGMASTLRPADLLAYVDRLLEAEAEATSFEGYARLQAVFEYVRDHWPEVSEELVTDVEAASPPVPLREALARRAWVPAERSADGLKGFAGHVVPEDRLYRPAELYQRGQAHLVASCAPIAGIGRQLTRVVQMGLGFPRLPRVSLVLLHFENLLTMWESPDHGGLDPATLFRSLQQVYRDLGGRLGYSSSGNGAGASAGDGEGDEGGEEDVVDIESAEVRARFANRACLWDNETKAFWRPQHTFAVSTACFGLRRATLSFEDAQADRGYEVLGRRTTIDRTDLIDFLMEVADDAKGVPIPEGERRAVLQVLAKLGDSLVDGGVLPPSTPVLTEDGRLLHASQLYDDDDSYHQQYLMPGAVGIVHSSVPSFLREQLPLGSLAGAIQEVIVGNPQESSDPDLTSQCRRLEATLRSPEFASGLRRLMLHRHPLLLEPDLSWLARMRVTPTEPFAIELWLNDHHGRRIVGGGDATFHVDTAAESVYLSGESAELVPDYLAQAINVRLGSQGVEDLAPLVRIITAEPAAIPRLLTRLRIRELRNDPEPPALQDLPGRSVRMDVEIFDDESDGIEPGTPFSESDGDTPTDVAGNERRSTTSGDVDNVMQWDDRDDQGDTMQALPSQQVGVEWEGEHHSADGLGAGEVNTASGGADEGEGPKPEIATHGDPDIESDLHGGVSERDGVAEPSDGPGPQSEHGDRRVRPAGTWNIPAGNAPRQPGAAVPDPNATRRGGGTSSGPSGQSGRDGRQRGGSPSGRGQQDRVVTYLTPGGSDDTARHLRDEIDLSDDELPVNHQIGRAAEQAVADEESRLGRQVTRMPHANPGFDIISDGQSDADRRYIEVKGLAGDWGAGGVPLSVRQFERAWREGESFWLYVVENALDPSRRQITRLHDPVRHVTQYRVDAGWRALAVPNAEAGSPGSLISTGQRVRFTDGRSGLVREVESFGQLLMVQVDFDGGAQGRMVYNPSTMSIDS